MADADRRQRVRVDYDVDTRDVVKGTRDIERMAGAVDDLGDEAKQTSRQLDGLADELDDVARSADKATTAVVALSAQQQRARQQTRDAGGRFVGAGGGGGDDDGSSFLRLLRKTGRSAARGVKNVPGALGDAIGKIQNPWQAGAIAAAGIVGGPPLLAGVGGATLAAGGLGAMGVGVAGAAADDPRIGARWGGMVEDLSKRWQAASRAFVEPTLGAIDMLEGAVDKIGLEEMLRDSAEFVEPLARGVSKMIVSIGEGWQGLVDKAGPTMRTLGVELGRMGDAIGAMFDEIGGGAEGGTRALQDLLHFVSSLIIVVGKVVRHFEDMYLGLVKIREALPGDFWHDEMAGVHGVAVAMEGAAGATDGYADAAKNAKEQTESMEDAMQRLLGIPLDLAEATSEWEAGLDELTESVKENGRVWDLASDKGRNNNEVVRKQLENALKLRDAQVAAGKQTGEANRELDANIAKLREQAVKAGMSAAQFDILAGALRNYLNQGSLKVVETRFISTGDRGGGGTPNSRGRQTAFASGGRFTPGVALVGEEGPELVEFDGFGRVHNAASTRSMMGGSGSVGGRTELVFAGAADSMFARYMMHVFRSNLIQLRVSGNRVVVVG